VKLLLFSDLHCDIAAAHKLAARSYDVDVLVGAGDFASVRRGLDKCLDVLQGVTRPMVFVSGNNESTEELQRACRGWTNTHVLHGTSVIIGGVTFFGLGGGVPVTPFGSWSYDLTEEQAADLLKGCPANSVLVSHSPPKGYCDTASNGQHLGSQAVLEAIRRSHPQLVVCGHIHGSAGRTMNLSDTIVTNAGPSGILAEVNPTATVGTR
jgi:Icc-related predicted phosphoesterase